MSTQTRNFACQNCGTPYQAVPPDDIHTLALISNCPVCVVERLRSYVETTYECQNCNFRNPMKWHEQDAHSPIEMRYAKKQMSEKRILFGGGV